MHLLSLRRGELVLFLTLGFSFACHAAELPALIDLAVGDATPIVRIYGRNPADFLGSENGNGIAFGDINGDGFDDMIIGAYLADPRIPEATDTGTVYVLYGSATISNTTINLNLSSELRRSTQVYGDDPRDSAGFSVASGDINNDGYDDILIGAIFADRIGATTQENEFDTGTAYIIFGSPSSPGRIIDLSDPPGTHGETRIIGASGIPDPQSLTPGDLAGWSIASGDVNGDGWDDVIVGARAADPLGRSDAGEVYIITGHPQIEDRIIDLEQGSVSVVTIYGGVAGGFAGWSVASGDANGDGLDDILIGAYAATANIARATAGEVYVVYGSIRYGVDAGERGPIDLAPGAVLPEGVEVTRIRGAAERDFLGWSLGSGDINADGFDDLIIGAPGIDRSSIVQESGGAYIVYGKTSLPNTTIELGSSFSASTATLLRGALTADQAGWSVAMTDADGDGFDDVIVGAIASNGQGREDTGRIYLKYGSFLRGTALVELGDATGTVRMIGENPLDLLGFGAEGGADMDRDGFADFAASAIFGDNPNLFLDNDSGAAYAAFGDGLAESATIREFFRSTHSPPFELSFGAKRGVGGRLAPVSRTWLEFDSGSASRATVTLTRSNESISGLGREDKRDVADVLWQITSDRVGYNTATVVFQYLDSEKKGLNERGLRLYHASNPAGPWVEVASQTFNTDRNEIRAEITSFFFDQRTYYALSTVPADLPPIIDLNVPLGEEASPVARIYGDNQDDFLGSLHGNGIAFGDVNGDGYDDVILGATGAERVGGTDRGDVYIVYGSDVLPATTVDLNRPFGFYGETRIFGEADADQTGYSVASGDLNADGYDDVIIGAPNSDSGGRSNAGKVYVIYGNPTISDSTIDLSLPPGTYGETQILGDDAGDRLGFSLASGDINSDAHDDIVIGAPFGNRGSLRGVGEAYIVYGGLIQGATVDLSDATFTNGETRILGEEAGDLLGFSVAVGEIMGDGVLDVIVGAAGSDRTGTNAGEVYVIPGAGGKPGTPQFPGSLVDLNLGAFNGVRIRGEAAGDQAGCSVASGDINRDGLDEVIIGARFADPAGDTSAGKAYVLYGSTVFSATTARLGGTAFSQTQIFGEAATDLAGVSVSAGDINGDGFEEVILGAIQADPPGGLNAGKTYVINGSTALPNSMINAITSQANVTVWGDDENDFLGYAAESGADVDRNGFADFVASARRGNNPFFDPLDNDAGLAAVIFGDGAAIRAGAREWFQPGLTTRRGIGGRLSPVVRTWMMFDGGSGPATIASVTLTRTKNGISGLGNGTLNDVANVHWRVIGNRPGASMATLTFQYLDSEVGDLYEPGLRMHSAPSLFGPWTDIASQVLDVTRNTITVTLPGNPLGFFAIRLPQEIDIVGGPLLFGEASVGCGGATQTVTIQNLGLSNLTFSSISFVGAASADYRIVAPTTGLLSPLPPDATRVISILFVPTQTGIRNAFLEIRSNDPDEPVSLIGLSGTGVNPEIEVEPLQVDFGVVALSPDQSATRTVTIRSLGDTPLEFTRIAILGEASREYFIIDPLAGLADPINAGQERVLTILFNPSSLLIREATLVINSNDCDEPTTEVILRGTATGNAPELDVFPRRIDFGPRDLCAGPSAVRTLTIRNVGNQPLEWTGVGITKRGVSSADILILTPTAAIVATPIPPGGVRTLQIAFDPSELGPRGAQIVITTNDFDEGTFIVPVTGRGEDSDIRISPEVEELDYGQISVCGNNSATETITITNLGNRNLNFTGAGIEIAGPAASEYVIVSPAGSALTRPIPPNRSRTIVLAFDPAEKSLRRARMLITTDDCDRPFISFRLFGRGLDPEIEVTPAGLDFGSADIAGESATRTLLIRNRGNYFLNFTGDGFKLLGEATSEYIIISPTPEIIAPLQAGATREVDIVFNPSSLRIREATLAITTDDCDEATSSVILSGTGTGIAPEIDLIPRHLNFGGWGVYAGPSPPLRLIIENIGNQPLQIFSILTGGQHSSDFTILSPTAPIVATPILPDETRELLVIFDPSARGARNARLRLSTNDPDESVLIVLLQGLGVAPDIDVSPSELDFDPLDVCGPISATQTLTVRSTGVGPLSFVGEGFEFTGRGFADYRIVSPTTGLTDPIPAGQARVLTIAFNPVYPGRRKAKMLILTDDHDEGIVSVTLFGRGRSAEIEILPKDVEMDFDRVSVCGHTFTTQSFTIRNQGNRPLEFVGPGIEFTGRGRFDFEIVSPTVDVFAPIGPGGSRTYEVGFDPIRRGRRKAKVVVHTNDCDESQISFLAMGRGVAPEIDIPSDQLEMDFDNTPTCTGTPPTLSLTIRNRGNQPLNFLGAGFTFSLPDYSIVSPANPTAPIPVFGERTIVVAFHPTSPGRKKGKLTITTDDCDEGRVNIPLYGRGIGSEIEVTPIARDFGSQSVSGGASPPQDITIRNTGNRPLNFTGAGIALTGANPTNFVIVSPTTGVTDPLGPFQTRTLSLAFDPSSEGAKSASLVITTNECDEPTVQVLLTGSGTLPKANEVEPARGSTQEGTSGVEGWELNE